MATPERGSAWNAVKGKCLVASGVFLAVAGCTTDGGTMEKVMGQNGHGQELVSFTVDFMREALAAFLL